jgi:hypothetical protein
MSDPPVLRIDSEFESIIPPLDEEEFRQLADNILRDGEIYHPNTDHGRRYDSKQLHAVCMRARRF